MCPIATHCVDSFLGIPQPPGSTPPVLRTWPLSGALVVTPLTVTSTVGMMPSGMHMKALGMSVDLGGRRIIRSEEHTSELQSHLNIVCRLLLEKKKYVGYTMY